MNAMNGLSQEPHLIDDDVPITPISEEVGRSSVTLPKAVWEDMAEAARKLSDRARKEGRKTFSRDELIAHACRWWLKAHRADNPKNRKD